MKYKYYSTQRPVSAGTYPKPKDNPAMLIHNFNERQYVTEIGRLAWGYIEYDKPLENEDIDGYELIPAAFFLIKKASRNMYTWKNGNYQHVGANIQKSIKIDTETMEIIEAVAGRSFSDKVRNMARLRLNPNRNSLRARAKDFPQWLNLWDNRQRMNRL